MAHVAYAASEHYENAHQVGIPGKFTSLEVRITAHMTSKAEAALPDVPAQAIRSAYDAAIAVRGQGTKEAERRLDRFLSLVAAAREAGWSLEAVGDLVGVTSRWLRKLLETHPVEPATRPKFPAGPLTRLHLSVEQARQLRDLAPIARGRRAHNQDPTTMEASQLFTELLVAHRANNVTWPELSAATSAWRTWPPARVTKVGITVSGLQARVQRRSQP